jgi:hypothetical protein
MAVAHIIASQELVKALLPYLFILLAVLLK